MDAGYELILAMFTRLRATAAVTDLVAGFYDNPPDSAAYPYVSIGPTSSIPDDFDCLYGEEVTVQLDVWSHGSNLAHSSVECRKISDAIKHALHDVDLTLTNNALVTLQWELTRILDDPDPAIKHGAIQFSATVETP